MDIDLSSLLNIVLRSTAVYFFMIIAFRIFGKRELSQLSVADLVLIVLISNSVQNAMVGGDSSLLGGIVAATVLFVLNMALSYVMYRVKFVRHLVQSEPMTLIYDGQLMQKNLDKVLLTKDELMAAIREHGIEKYEDVKLAILEVDGNISVISGSDEHLRRTSHIHKRAHKTLPNH